MPSPSNSVGTSKESARNTKEEIFTERYVEYCAIVKKQIEELIHGLIGLDRRVKDIINPPIFFICCFPNLALFQVETNCNCCLPVIKEVDTHTFDCFDEIAPRRLKIRMIQTCKCHICARDSESGNSNGMIKVEDNDILPNKREAALISL